MKILKQATGIDVSKKDLMVTLGRLQEDLSTELYAGKKFLNNEQGFTDLLNWVKQLTRAEVGVQFVMEATGVYHESLSYWLIDQGCIVSIVMPNKISNFFKTLEIKTITDKTASQAIALFGLEKKLDAWQKPQKVYRTLRQVTRERGQLIDERTLLKNQLHAEHAEAFPSKKAIQRIQARIKLLDKQVQEVMEEITEIVNRQEELNKMIAVICSIPGVGLLTAATVLAETNGFELIRNKKQLTSFAGLDIKEKESGTSVKKKPKISKKGNRYLRKAMHFPALTAIRHDERFKAIFARLISRHGIKMKAAVAVQRKILEMIYTLCKNNTTYDKNYLTKNSVVGKEAA